MAHYVIRGGEEGKARLQIISDALRPSTLNLLNNAGIKTGMSCLDVGCGGGNVTLAMARLVGLSGMATGVDMDSAKMQLA
jgi:ubiquinone/menaquinone biosynthesis C-methylase UbiE